MGIISLLDENCLIAESTDQSTLEKLNKYKIDNLFINQTNKQNNLMPVVLL